MTNRKIPYGYRINMGRLEPHPRESETVRRIYNEYVSGKSYLDIARTLTAEQVVFVGDRYDWNKNRVKRILEDGRYTGTAKYPPIIPAEQFNAARTTRESRANNISDGDAQFPLTCPVECSVCGEKLQRRRAKKPTGNKIYWKCRDGHLNLSMPEDALYERLTELLNALIAEPRLIQSPLLSTSADDEPPLPVRRLQNEVDRQLDSLDFDKEKLTADILSLAAEKYKAIDANKIMTETLRAELEQKAPLSRFEPSLFHRLTAKIKITPQGEIIPILKNGQEIENSKITEREPNT